MVETFMRKIDISLTIALFLSIASAHATECQIKIEANDLMQYDQNKLTVPASCAAVELTLKHTGKYPVSVMGHDWVLARTADVDALTSAGKTAGLTHNYLPENDLRVLAATKVVGGGEMTSINFSTEKLSQGGDYTFFCSAPGHSNQMKGRFSFGSQADTRTADK
jgi:azurin